MKHEEKLRIAAGLVSKDSQAERLKELFLAAHEKMLSETQATIHGESKATYLLEWIEAVSKGRAANLAIFSAAPVESLIQLQVENNENILRILSEHDE